MSYTVVDQRNVRGSLRQRLAIELQVSHSAADAARILNRDLVTRGAVPKSEIVASPATRYAGIEEQFFAPQTKSEYPLETRPIHPSGGTRVPGPSAAPYVRRYRVNVGAGDVRLDLIAVNGGARVGMIDGVQH